MKRTNICLFLWASIGIGIGLGTELSPIHAAQNSLVVENQAKSLGETPVVTSCDASIATGSYHLISPEGDRSSSAFVYEESGERKLVALFSKLPSGKTAYTLEGPLDPTAPSSVIFEDDGTGLKIQVNQIPFAEYTVSQGPKPILARLRGPDGERITRAYPLETIEGETRDHPHHRSFWFTHGLVNGVDFWSEAERHGSIHETTREVMTMGQVGGSLVTSNDWLDAGGKKICDDTRTLRIYGTQNSRVFDFEVQVRATATDVVLGDTKEGTFAIRVASSMDANRKDGGHIVNAEGLTDTKTWGKRSAWVDYSGPVGEKTLGIAIFDHPASYGHPTPWHVRDYGLFAANPFGLHDFGEKTSGDVTIPKGASLRFVYRVVIHRGNASDAHIESQYASYASPPKITFEAR